MKAKLHKLVLLVKSLGWRWLLFRVQYAFAVRVGYFVAKSPAKAWKDVGVPQGKEGGVPGPSVRCEMKEYATREIIVQAGNVLQGRFCYYFNNWVSIGEFPDWHKNYITGERAPCNRHWSRMGDFDYGDIKNIWELSRFGWAYTLAQAYHIEVQERYAERFWTLFENWMAENPPNLGVNWKCGQEAALRMMAVMYARGVFAPAAATSPLRTTLYRKFVLVTGQRIFANISYALSQKNNHGISECVGLIAAGLVLSREPETREWESLGMKHLQRQVAELVYPDGGFSQFSINYHRVVLDNFIWLMCLLRVNGQSIPRWLTDAAYRAAMWLYSLVGRETGRVPCWGANDGAWILPLGGSNYLDYRPAVQGCMLLSAGIRGYIQPELDYLLLMLGVAADEIQSAKPLSPSAKEVTVFPDCGVAVIRSGQSMGMLRGIRTFRHRPGHSDLLHFNLMYKDRGLILDPGSYSYNLSGHMGALGLESHGPGDAHYHNAPLLNDCEPMSKLGRFLYLPWPSGKIGQVVRGKKRIEAEHYAYRNQSTVVRREVTCAAEGCWMIRDSMSGSCDEAFFKWHWLFPTCEYKLDEADKVLMMSLNGENWVFSWTLDGSLWSVKALVSDLNSFYGKYSSHYQSYSQALSLHISARECVGAAFTMKVV